MSCVVDLGVLRKSIRISNHSPWGKEIHKARINLLSSGCALRVDKPKLFFLVSAINNEGIKVGDLHPLW